MRELERDLHPTPTAPPPAAVAIVGAGRVGGALARAAAAASVTVRVAGRDDALEACREAEAAVLAVPDAAIAEVAETVAAAVPPLRLVGHTSGATGLEALASCAAAGAATFSVHPLQTVPGPDSDLTGAPCAVSGSDAAAEEFARGLAERLGMRPFTVPEEHRAAYHAAASIASNFLVALEESASELLARTGVAEARELLAPLVLRTAANWAESGSAALTGPIARGDEATVERHRAAIAELAPELTELYEALAERTRELARGDAMTRVVRTKAELRDALAPARREGSVVGLVPTMGFLHEGHLALLRAARERADVVVMSLFVNPAQFRPGEDLDAYPRDEARDLALAEAESVDLVFAPDVAEVYPQGFATSVEVAGLTDVLDGDPGRRGAEHFRGVTTVVAKLFNVVAPDLAYFGQKDAQQALVIKRMAADLDYAVEVVVLPTVREGDGLAMSSRNAYLTAEERKRASALNRALRRVEAAVAGGETSAAEVLAAAREELAAARWRGICRASIRACEESASLNRLRPARAACSKAASSACTRSTRTPRRRWIFRPSSTRTTTWWTRARNWS